MVNLANIKIWDNIVGYLLWREETETTTFEYASEFKRLGFDLSPIGYKFAKEYDIPAETIKQIGNTLQLSNF